MATIMTANVFFIIIPNQKKVVAALKAGEVPDARYGKMGKQRSMHNNYITLPVLFLMLSNHYPLTYATNALDPAGGGAGDCCWGPDPPFLQCAAYGQGSALLDMVCRGLRAVSGGLDHCPLCAGGGAVGGPRASGGRAGAG